MQIDAQPQAYGNLNDLGQYGSGQYLSDQEYFATEHKKLHSRVQARAVFDILQLESRPEFADEDDPIQKFNATNRVQSLKPHLGTDPRLLYAGLDKEVR